MDKQALVAKKALYEAKKVELSLETYEAQIEAEVAAARKEIEAKYAEIKQKDEVKIDCYLELLTELIADADKTEASAEVAEDTPIRGFTANSVE